MSKCPRCGLDVMRKSEATNSLSRRDNKTYICSLCGNEEAFFDLAVSGRVKEIKNTRDEVQKGRELLLLSGVMADENSWLKRPKVASKFMGELRVMM